MSSNGIDLITSRLILEAISPEHAEDSFSLLSDPTLYDFVPQDPPASLDALRLRLNVLRSGSRDVNEIWLNWFLREKRTGHLVGFLQSTVKKPTASAFIAYQTFAEHRRLGYAREGCLAVIAHLIEAHFVKSVLAEVDARNVASQCLLRSIGFRCFAEVPSADFFKGQISDEFHYRLDVDGQSLEFLRELA